MAWQAIYSQISIFNYLLFRECQALFEIHFLNAARDNPVKTNDVSPPLSTGNKVVINVPCIHPHLFQSYTTCTHVMCPVHDKHSINKVYVHKHIRNS